MPRINPFPLPNQCNPESVLNWYLSMEFVTSASLMNIFGSGGQHMKEEREEPASLCCDALPLDSGSSFTFFVVLSHRESWIKCQRWKQLFAECNKLINASVTSTV